MNQARRQAFLARVAQDLAAAHSAALVVIGDRLGLYRALTDGGGLTPGGLAARTATHERYVTEWLRNQTASGYVQHDPARGTYALSDEQAQVLADEGSAAFAVPAFQLAAGLAFSIDDVADAFRTGAGLAPGAYGRDVREGIGRQSRALCAAYLGSRWLAAVPEAMVRLAAGGSGADIGCGRGDAVIALAQQFPRATFAGIDLDATAVEHARRAAVDARVVERVHFEVSSAEDFHGSQLDLVTCIDALHDMPRPLHVARRMRSALAEGGCLLVVEPSVAWAGGEDVLARLLSAVSTLYCVPVGRGGGGEGRGALESEESLCALLGDAGFARVDVVQRLPLNVVVVARA